MRPAHSHTGTLIDEAAVARRWQAHRAGQADERLLLWAWAGLQEVARAMRASAPAPVQQVG